MDKDTRFNNLPAIETERLLLRTLKMEDAEDIFEWVSDPQVTTYLFWRAHQSIEDSRDFIAWVTSDDFACWGVVLNENSKVIGNCFLHNVNFEHKRAEIAFNIGRKYWGRVMRLRPLKRSSNSALNVGGSIGLRELAWLRTMPPLA